MNNSDVWKIINSYFNDNPQSLVCHHIESYNDFFTTTIFKIFKDKNPIKLSSKYDKTIDDFRYQCIMYFGGKDGKKIYFGKPIIYDENDNSLCEKKPNINATIDESINPLYIFGYNSFIYNNML